MASATDVSRHSLEPQGSWREESTHFQPRIRRRKSARDRQQRERQGARVIGALLKGVAQLHAHRGNHPTSAMQLLAEILKDGPRVDVSQRPQGAIPARMDHLTAPDPVPLPERSAMPLLRGGSCP